MNKKTYKGNFAVYALLFPNGKYYIGQTSNLLRRMKHYHYINNHKKSKNYISRAIIKYQDFDVKIIIRNISSELADLVERYFIQELNTLAPNGYNITTGRWKNWTHVYR